jgi:hypothetical protein
VSRWFRFYDEALNDPKVQRLAGETFKAWVNLLCLASKSEDGVLPPIADIAFALRLTEEQTSDLLNQLYKLQLFDEVEVPDAPMSYTPHNWKARQYKTDITDPTTAARSKRYRDAKRDANRDGTVTVTDTRADTEQITETEKKGGAEAPETNVVSAYAWSGQVIRLSRLDYDGWRKVYSAVPDFDAELRAADDYYAANPPKEGKWFFPVSNWLKKAHQDAAERRRKKVPRL